MAEPVDEILRLARASDEEAARAALREHLGDLLQKERQRAERSSVVAMSEEDAVRYRAISELASDFVYALRVDSNTKLNIEWVKGSFQRLTGYSEQEVEESGGWLNLLHPDDRAKRLALPLLAPTSQPTTFEYRILTKTGEERWFRDYACPEMDASGQRIIRIFGAVKDVTVEKNAQESLHEAKKRLEEQAGFNEARFRAVLDQAGEAIYMIDPMDGSFIDVNETACRMLGYSRNALLQMTVKDVEAGEPEWLRPEQVKALRIRSLSHESFHRRSDGHTFPVEIAVSIRRYDGRDYLLASAREITERKQMEVQLAQADRLASVGVLAAGVAHEVNNPLVYILNNVSYALAELPAEYPELRDALREARSGAERVRDIVQDLKTFARSEERVGPIDVRRVLETAIRLASNEIRFRATLDLAYDDNIPTVRASDRLGQVFLNLLMNAAHSIQEGRPAQNTIRCNVRHVAGRVAVSVSDTGSGIASDTLGKIFDPFFTTKPIGTGTGLGLSICRNITKSFGGDIEVESEIGRGSTFTVWLPAMVDPSAREARQSSTPPPQNARSMRVLVVDDDPFVARAVSRLLRNQHSVVVASGGAEALNHMAKESFDAIFCDVMMPTMTGMDLLGEVRRRYPDMAERFVFITGGAFTPEARAFLEQSDTVWLQKPFSPKDLIAALDQAVAPKERIKRSSSHLRAVIAV
ncbi:MAG TPA: PAS domain S-box protein [Polyangiaceae bacterium]|nr:PAS domain S-box protein [Polyangiaceae bacterium]